MVESERWAEMPPSFEVPHLPRDDAEYENIVAAYHAGAAEPRRDRYRVALERIVFLVADAGNGVSVFDLQEVAGEALDAV